MTQGFDLAVNDFVVDSHMHCYHCGGNHLFAGKPIYVQRLELDNARSVNDFTIRVWVVAPVGRYVPVRQRARAADRNPDRPYALPHAQSQVDVVELRVRAVSSQVVRAAALS